MLMKTNSALSERAMIARLTIEQWSATKLDRRVTKQATEANNAADSAGRFNKRLVSKDALAGVQKIAKAARDRHYAQTLPWEHDGTRILSMAGYLAYAAEMQKFRVDFEAAADLFESGFADFVQDAKAKLGDMFNSADYPSPETIRREFSFAVKIDPLPDAGDFRVMLGDAQAAAIRDDIEARTHAAISAAMRDVWQRVADRVGHMRDKLSGFKPSEGKGDKSEGIFRDSLVENVRELVTLLPSLNVTNDPDLARVAARMAAELTREDADTLRDNATTRASVAAAADSILRDVSDYLA